MSEQQFPRHDGGPQSGKSRDRAMADIGAGEMRRLWDRRGQHYAQRPKADPAIAACEGPDGFRIARGMAGGSVGAGQRCLRGAFRALLQGRLWRAAASLPADPPDRARQGLLRDTDLAITDIAFQTGWNSLGTFGRVFRDITGESPSELRRGKGRFHTLWRTCPLLRQRSAPAQPQNRSFGEAAAGGRR